MMLSLLAVTLAFAADTLVLEPVDLAPRVAPIEHVVFHKGAVWALYPYGPVGPLVQLLRIDEDGPTLLRPRGLHDAPGEVVLQALHGAAGPLQFDGLFALNDASGRRLFATYSGQVWEVVDGTIRQLPTPPAYGFGFDSTQLGVLDGRIVAFSGGTLSILDPEAEEGWRELTQIRDLPPIDPTSLWHTTGFQRRWVHAPAHTKSRSARLFASDAAGVWLAGEHGGVWHSMDGVTWQSWPIELFRKIVDFRATSPNDAWIAAEGGASAHWDGKSWTRVHTQYDHALLTDNGPFLATLGSATYAASPTQGWERYAAVMRYKPAAVAIAGTDGGRVAAVGNGVVLLESGGRVHTPIERKAGYQPPEIRPLVPPKTTLTSGLPPTQSLHTFDGEVYWRAPCAAVSCIFHLGEDGPVPLLGGVGSVGWDGGTVLFQGRDALMRFDLITRGEPEQVAPVTGFVAGILPTGDGAVLYGPKKEWVRGGTITPLTIEGQARAASANHLWTAKQGGVRHYVDGFEQEHFKGQDIEHTRGDWMVIRTGDTRETVGIETGQRIAHPCAPNARSSVTEDGRLLTLYTDDGSRAWLVESRGKKARRWSVPNTLACPIGVPGHMMGLMGCGTELAELDGRVLVSKASHPVIYALSPRKPKKGCFSE